MKLQTGAVVTRPLARVALVALAALGLLAGAAAPAQAAPANPHVVKTLRQPDGTKLKVRLWGDEFFHGFETLNGYTIVYDRRDRRYEYAERTKSGRLKASGKRATPAGRPDGIGAHLRPSASAVQSERAAAGAPTFESAAAAGAPGWAGSDTDVLFLIAEFTDTGCSFTPVQHESNMFGGTATGPGDLDDYFDEISYGDLQFDGDVVGTQDGTDCITLADDRDRYNTGPGQGDDVLVREAVEAADAYVDFSDYDNDGDGFVDALGIIYAGGGPHDGCSIDAPPDGGDGDNLWPHSGRVNDGLPLMADGKIVERFIINSEVTYSLADDDTCDQIQTIGLFAHELGHSLGLPDLYDTQVGWGGVDTWSAMSSQYLSTVNLSDTPPHYDPWSKAVLGWVTPTEHPLDEIFLESLPEAATSSEVHQFLPNLNGFETGDGLGEYFLVENRQKVGFDAQLAGCGLLVWHVDETRSNNQDNDRRLVDVEQADGLFQLNDNAAADAGDPFPGSADKRLFGDTTTPSSKLYSGLSSGVRMRVRTTDCAPSMEAVFGPNEPPEADAGGPYTTPEGTDEPLTALGSTDANGDALTYEWGINAARFTDAFSATPSLIDVGDNGDELVGVTVTDVWGERDTDTATVEVTNVAPSVTDLATAGSLLENTAVDVTALASDPGWLDTLTVTIDWGDGSGPQPVAGGTSENVRPNATRTIAAQHVYGDNGTYTITVCATDDDEATGACPTTQVTIANVTPAAAVDESGAVLINGVPTILASAGDPQALSGRVTDPGSDDLTLTWAWGDGSPDQVTKHRVNPPFDDPFPSPSIEPRDVTENANHTFEACVYEVGFRAQDDDGAVSATDTVRVLVTGNAQRGRQSGYWAREYRRTGKVDHTDAELQCYLEIAGFVSQVYHEVRDATTFQRAQEILFAQGTRVSERDQLDRDLLTAWLNFSDGAVGYDEPVDTDGNGTADTAFSAALQTAEAVRLDPAATKAQVDAQRVIVNRINDQL